MIVSLKPPCPTRILPTAVVPAFGLDDYFNQVSAGLEQKPAHPVGPQDQGW